MGRIEEKDNKIDVICQHSKDGSMYPIKIRIVDEDHERHTYAVRRYRDLTVYGPYDMPNGVQARNHLWTYECIILVFDTERRVKISYNSLDNVWRLL